jgi:hypothetical protein
MNAADAFKLSMYTYQTPHNVEGFTCKLNPSPPKKIKQIYRLMVMTER